MLLSLALFDGFSEIEAHKIMYGRFKSKLEIHQFWSSRSIRIREIYYNK